MDQQNGFLWRRRSLVMAMAGAGLGPAFGQTPAGAMPNSRVVRILVGFPPGQATDIVARLLTEGLHAATGENYIVDNRPGQGGSLALGQLAKAPNDGSVMMLAHMSALCTNPFLYRSVPYDTLKDFEPVGMVGDLPFVMVCNPQLPIKNVQDLVAYAKANPDKLTNASSGNGTVSHLAMEEFKRRAGIRMVHVPYKGSGAGLTDVVAGTVSMALETASGVQPFVRAGRLQFLGSGTAKRLTGALDGPTVAEQGFPGFTAVTWLMMMCPLGTPRVVIDTTFRAMNALIVTPEIEQRLITAGALPRTSKSPEEAVAYLNSEYKYWGDAVKRSGTTLD